MASDAELIAAVAAGDGHALDGLYRRYERPLYQFLFRHGGARDVEDRVQETWLRVVAAAPRFDPSRRFSTWLFQIALNLCRDWRRRPPPEPVDPTTIERTAEGAGSAQSMEDAVDADRLLAALPDAQRSVLVLRYYCDRTEAEVAEILECPIGTVKSRTHEAIARLADLVHAEPSAGAATRAGSTPAPPAGAPSTHGGTPAREKRS
jgi:RNA polymerase sigma-70 factor (ECF subfamily)